MKCEMNNREKRNFSELKKLGFYIVSYEIPAKNKIEFYAKHPSLIGIYFLDQDISEAINDFNFLKNNPNINQLKLNL
jgi:hypothetical protein